MREVAMECPRCHKKGLVRCEHSEDDLFQCVYCDYQHDLTKAAQNNEGQSAFSIYMAILTALVMLAAIFAL